MKGIIVYKGKYGATRQYAQWVGETFQLFTHACDDPHAVDLAACDFVLLGSSVYVGKLQIKNWLVEHQVILQHKKIFLFVVCGTPASEKEKLNKLITDNIPASLLPVCSIYFLPGRVILRQLSWRDRLMLKVGAMLAKKEDGERMLKGYDLVNRQRLEDLEAGVHAYLQLQQKQAVAPA